MTRKRLDESMSEEFAIHLLAETEREVAKRFSTFLPVEDGLLLALYDRQPHEVDHLHNTSAFDSICHWFWLCGGDRSKAEVSRRLLDLRKAGRLKGKGRKPKGLPASWK